MYSSILGKPSLFSLLLDIDRKSLEEYSSRKCPHCGGPLDRAHYLRKPRGVIGQSDPAFSLRFSLCCRVEGCRKRLSPPSVRFYSRRVWVASVFLVAGVLSGGLNQKATEEFKSQLGVSSQLLRRWRRYWAESFASSRFWLRYGYLFSPTDLSLKPFQRLLRNFGDVCSDLIAHSKLLICLLASNFEDD